tara:strand:+ start:201 stop:515 length:315 start_codon:yes stop_codon:yes gene_type:complete
MATLIYRRTMQVHMDKLDEAMRITTEQAKIFKELTGNDELVSFQIGGNPRTICRQRMVQMDKLGEDDSKVSADPKWQELEKQHKGVFVDGTMVDEMRYVINMPE